jgi:hypothetical protein
MAKKLKEINELELVDYYENNEISVRLLSRKFGINSARAADILKQHDSRKYKINSARHGHKKPWNKGLDKTDPRIAKSLKLMSTARVKTGVRSGYQTIFVEELGRRIKLHDYVWFKNTGYLPNGKNYEQVHHIDGDKNNNSIENLLLTNVSEHSKIHKEYEDVFFKLLKLGFIGFNKEKRGVDWDSFNEMVEKLKM